ncbi:MAG: DUF2326 domain-containing protein [Pyrinomonadaceae bacterium]|nr:DUF2326 domain-containing protein [Pyrinomonadaceae bacterium]
MKLSSVYTNKPKIFSRINFNEGFNIIFAKVKDPTKKNLDNHNLGKTFLIKVIDFILLADIDNSHPFREKTDVFGDFVFFLEIKTHDDKFVTIRRPVKQDTNICIKVSDKRNQNFSDLVEESWDLHSLSLKKARNELNNLLNLTILGNYSYRRGMGYVLRTQADYDEVFRISKFQRGKDEHWKPLVARLLGFNDQIILEKYKLQDELKEKQKDLGRIENEAGSTSGEYDELKGLVELATASAERLRNQLEEFSFKEIEAEINDRLVSDIEAEISKINQRRYIIDYELQEIAKSLETEIDFDIDKIQKLFKEVQVELPDNLVKSYEDLIKFNERISVGREKRLQELKTELISERNDLEKLIQELDADRTSALAFLQEKKTFEKFKRQQRELSKKEADVIELNNRLSQLDKATTIQKDLDKTQEDINEVSKKIFESVRGENNTYSLIRTTFSDFVEKILNVQALLSVPINKSGNLDFNVRTLDPKVPGRETDEGDGTSYKKILCVCFDLTLLSVYATERFYHFVYHDGMFEGLDNRKKVNFVNLLKEICTKKNIQHILTVIDSDLPRDEKDEKLLFEKKDIIRELHDNGDSGRLFRMKPF